MRKLTLLVILVLAGSIVLQGREETKLTEDEGKILALESIWNRAEQSKDISALDHIFAPNLVYVDSDGSLRNKEQFLAYVKNESATPDQLVTEEVVPHSYGDCIVVTGVYRGKWTKNGKQTVIRGRFTDTWVKLNGNWQCAASQATATQH